MLGISSTLKALSAQINEVSVVLTKIVRLCFSLVYSFGCTSRKVIMGGTWKYLPSLGEQSYENYCLERRISLWCSWSYLVSIDTSGSYVYLPYNPIRRKDYFRRFQIYFIGGKCSFYNLWAWKSGFQVEVQVDFKRFQVGLSGFRFLPVCLDTLILNPHQCLKVVMKDLT